MIATKDKSVQLKILSPAIMHIFNTLFNLNELKIPNYPDTWTITSINDGKHMQGSKHYSNQAVDLRSKDFVNSTLKQEFQARLQFGLGNKFTVLIEDEDTPNEHFHIQVKKGESFP